MIYSNIASQKLLALDLVKEASLRFPGIEFYIEDQPVKNELKLSIEWGKAGELKSFESLEFFEDLLYKGLSFNEVVEEFCCLVSGECVLDTHKVARKNYVLSHVIPVVAGTLNKDMLSRPLDGTTLHIGYRVLQLQKGKNKSIPLLIEDAEKLPLTEEDVYKAALENMKSHVKLSALPDVALRAPEFSACSDFEKSFLLESARFSQEIIMNYGNDDYGAGAILYTEVLEELSSRFDVEKLVILPSSKHEIIVRPFIDGLDDASMWLNMVKQVNGLIEPKDYLVDDIFFYTSKEKKLSSYAMRVSKRIE